MRTAIWSRYSLIGPESAPAVESGLADVDWFRADVPRRRMKELMRRRDWPAIRDTCIWIGTMAVSGTAGVLLWPSWLCAPCFLVYGVLYGSASDSRWHESGHGTPFRTPWLNKFVYQLAS